jgi:hypothetical protein
MKIDMEKSAIIPWAVVGGITTILWLLVAVQRKAVIAAT